MVLRNGLLLLCDAFCLPSTHTIHPHRHPSSTQLPDRSLSINTHNLQMVQLIFAKPPRFLLKPHRCKKTKYQDTRFGGKKRNPWIGFHCLDLFGRYETNELTIWKDLFTFLMTCLVFSRDSISPNPGRSAGKHPLIANLLSVNVLAVLKCTKHHFGSRLPLNWTSSRKAGKSGSKVTCCSV